MATITSGNFTFTDTSIEGVKVVDVIGTTVSIPGYKDLAIGDWYTSESMDVNSKVNENTKITDKITGVYAKAELKSASVRISVGEGVTVYIDDLRVGSGYQGFTVGEHTITIQVTPGYTGTPVITLGGQTITGGTFTITTDMAEQYEFSDKDTDNYIVLSIMVGDLAIDTGATGGDDGMGLTEILLVILVILIVVMAIMVALRLMRS